MIDNITFNRRASEAKSFTLEGEDISKELVEKIGKGIPLRCAWREDMSLNVSIDYGKIYGDGLIKSCLFNGLMELIEVNGEPVSQKDILEGLTDELLEISETRDSYERYVLIEILAHNTGVCSITLEERMDELALAKYGE